MHQIDNNFTEGTSLLFGDQKVIMQHNDIIRPSKKLGGAGHMNRKLNISEDLLKVNQRLVQLQSS